VSSLQQQVLPYEFSLLNSRFKWFTRRTFFLPSSSGISKGLSPYSTTKPLFEAGSESSALFFPLSLTRVLRFRTSSFPPSDLETSSSPPAYYKLSLQISRYLITVQGRKHEVLLMEKCWYLSPGGPADPLFLRARRYPLTLRR